MYFLPGCLKTERIIGNGKSRIEKQKGGWLSMKNDHFRFAFQFSFSIPQYSLVISWFSPLIYVFKTEER